MRRGRFAPSPSGPLHFGSLIAALASYLEARRNSAEWLLRIDDLDTPRVVAGAADKILYTLDRYGFVWDGDVLYQSDRRERYQQALRDLDRRGLVYRCTCTRREIAAVAPVGADGARIYPGTCRSASRHHASRAALRLLTGDECIQFDDTLQGTIGQRLQHDVGDFVLRRADGIFSYQLAVVVDDADQGISDIVRGSDLLDSTPRQIYLQRCLGLPTPRYTHFPVAVDRHGDKLSKQTRAPALDDNHPVASLFEALRFLNQNPPARLKRASLSALWQWALQNWRLERVSACRSLPLPALL